MPSLGRNRVFFKYLSREILLLVCDLGCWVVPLQPKLTLTLSRRTGVTWRSVGESDGPSAQRLTFLPRPGPYDIYEWQRLNTHTHTAPSVTRQACSLTLYPLSHVTWVVPCFHSYRENKLCWWNHVSNDWNIIVDVIYCENRWFKYQNLATFYNLFSPYWIHLTKVILNWAFFFIFLPASLQSLCETVHVQTFHLNFCLSLQINERSHWSFC